MRGKGEGCVERGAAFGAATAVLDVGPGHAVDDARNGLGDSGDGITEADAFTGSCP